MVRCFQFVGQKSVIHTLKSCGEVSINGVRLVSLLHGLPRRARIHGCVTDARFVWDKSVLFRTQCRRGVPVDLVVNYFSNTLPKREIRLLDL